MISSIQILLLLSVTRRCVAFMPGWESECNCSKVGYRNVRGRYGRDVPVDVSQISGTSVCCSLIGTVVSFKDVDVD